MSEEQIIHVAISYSWAIQPKAMELADALTEDGIEVHADFIDLKVGNDLFKFMEDIIINTEYNKIIVLCDETYTKKANDRLGGVGTETSHLSRMIYKDANQDRIIPVIISKNKKADSYKPWFLENLVHIDMSENWAEGYVNLLRTIYDRPVYKKKPLGKKPSFLDDDTKESTLYIKSKICSFSLKKSAKEFHHHFSDYLDSLAAELDLITDVGQLTDTKSDYSMFLSDHLKLLKELTLHSDNQKDFIYVKYRDFILNLFKQNENFVFDNYHRFLNDNTIIKCSFGVLGFYFLTSFMMRGDDACYNKIFNFIDHVTTINSISLTYDLYSRMSTILKNPINNKLKTNYYSPIIEIINLHGCEEDKSYINLIDFILFIRCANFDKKLEMRHYYPISYPYWSYNTISIKSFKSKEAFKKIQPFLGEITYQNFLDSLNEKAIEEIVINYFKGEMSSGSIVMGIKRFLGERY